MENTVTHCGCDIEQGLGQNDDGVCMNCWASGFQIVNNKCTNCPQGMMVYLFQKDNICGCYNEGQGFGLDVISNLCKYCWKDKQKVVNHKCQPCGDDTVFSVSENICICEKEASGFGKYIDINNATLCKDCWKDVQEVRYHWCATCSGKYIFSIQEKKCVCDESKGNGLFLEICQNCWEDGQQIVDHKCKACDIVGATFSITDMKCICDESKGYGQDQDPTKCRICSQNNQEIVSNKCSDCKPGFVWSPSEKKCVCDEKNGYGQDQDPSQCKDCWRDGYEIISHQCSACQSDYVWSSNYNSCICDKALGFAPSQNGCQSCWINQMVVQQSQCVLCSNQFINSVFDQNSHTCICKVGFQFKNSGCTKKSSNKTVAIAVSVPIAVVLAVILTVIVIIKKKALKKNVQTKDLVVVQEPDVQVAQETQLPNIITDNIEVVPENEIE
ncbi:Conserved_hypothetical protein [Hexamita inflata]|uniref:Uncharacterized protein n=1 Tax=Hexamita inflata TaxID=28002 RepID=A0AA86NIN4_9EUKA|nr:Conserved hypothetical protein [Hexamita inflata]